MIRILKVIGWPLCPGGHILSTLSLAQGIGRCGFEVFIASPEGPLLENFISAGLRFIPCETLLEKSPWHLMAFFTLVRAVKKQNIKLIHAMDYKALYPCYLTAAYLGIPLIFTKAGGDVPKYRIPSISKVIVFSEELARGMRERYGDLISPIELIKERIDNSLFTPVESPSSQNKDLLNVFMAMRLEEGKRMWLETAINAMENLKKRSIPFKFTLAGDGPLRKELENRISRIRRYSSGEFCFLGGVADPAMMVHCYRGSDIVIGHGQGVLEAMACGKPVVVLGSGSRGTIVGPETVKLICEYNFSGRHMDVYPEVGGDLAEMIIALKDDSQRRINLERFSRRYIEEEYSLEVGIKKLAFLYRKSLDEPLIETFPKALFWFLNLALFRNKVLE